MAQDTNQPPASPATEMDPNEGPGKGKAFFDRARTVAATGNFDYAIDMYIEGLNREPFNVEEHKALREVAMRRKIAGGKVRSGLLGLGGVKTKYKGKSPKEAMLNNEFLLARDVGSITAMLAVLRNANLLNLREVVMWIGPLLRQANQTSKSPKVEIYEELAEVYAKYDEFAKACDVINEAAQLKPQDMELAAKVTHYAAQETLRKGRYAEAESFQDSIKDREMTKQLLEEENLGRSEEYRRKMLVAAKTDYEANPKELQVIAKYAKALVDMDEESYENQAIELLTRAFSETKIYRLKLSVGDIRMKQFKRNLRVLREALNADPSDKEMLGQFEQLNRERLNYELEEFKERDEHMPTDMHVKHEYGLRLWEAKRYDEAIEQFQQAQTHPKHRVDAMHFLGRAFLIQGMTPEAVETLRRSIEEYDLAPSGDRKSKELHYWYARALEQNKQTADAIEIYSKIIRWDIRYHDARKRLDDLRSQAES